MRPVGEIVLCLTSIAAGGTLLLLIAALRCQEYEPGGEPDAVGVTYYDYPEVHNETANPILPDRDKLEKR